MSSSTAVVGADRWRCVLVGLGGTAVAGGTTAVLLVQLRGALHAAATGSGAGATWGARPEDAVVHLCLLALLVAVAVGWLQLVAAVAEAWRGAAPGRRGGVVRRLVLAACGVAVVGALGTAPGQAATAPAPHAAHTTALPHATPLARDAALPHAGTAGRPHHDPLAGLPLPDRATGGAPGGGAGEGSGAEPRAGAQPHDSGRAGAQPRAGARADAQPRARGRAGASDDAVVVVRPGDSLWSLARDELAAPAARAAAPAARAAAPAPSDAEVAAAWQRLYRENRALIGADPDLIRPGQRLALPEVRNARHVSEDPR